MNNDFEKFINFIKEINNNFCLLVTASSFETSNLEKIIKPYKNGDTLLKFIYKENNYIFGKIENMYVLNVECTIGSSGKNGSTLVTFESLAFNPRITFLVGIAFGNKDYSKIGDVIISTNIYDYEKCTIKDDADEPEKIKSMLKQPYFECSDKLLTLLPTNNSATYSIQKGTIISGEKLCSSETFLNKITAKIPTVWVGGEMEGTGFASACLRSKYNNWCVIKGISDFGDKSKRNNKKENQTTAIANLIDYLKFIFSDLEKFNNLEYTTTPLESNLINMLIKNSKSDEKNLTFFDSFDIKIYQKLNLPNSIITRSEMKDFIEIIPNKTWINIYGSALSGKTIFVKQFLIEHENYYYINLSNNLNINIVDNLQLLLKNNKFRKDSIIVLDDFPKLNSYDSFLQSFIDFIEILHEKNIKIITIQNEKVNSAILDYFNTELFYNFSIENITKSDVYSFLELYKISKDKISNKELDLILAICKRKIYLLNQLFQYFKINNWNISSCILDALFKKDTNLSNNELQLLLLNKITDESSRELLYRLSQIIEPITYDNLVKIANIPPSISNVNEKFSKLINIWITENEEHKYYINDNIKKITELNINSETKISINSILADEIINKKRLNQLDVCNVIIHLCLANRHNEAAKIYILSMQELINTNACYKDYLFTGIWKNIKLPNEINYNLQLDIRLRQIVYFKQQNIQLQKTLELSKDLFYSPQCPMLVKFGIPLLIYDVNFKLANQSLMECIKYVRNNNTHILPDDSPIFKMCTLEQLLLTIVLGIKNIDDIIIWLNNFSELTIIELDNIFNETKLLNGANPKELFNCALEIFKSNIKNNNEFILLAETYFNLYQDVKEKNKFLTPIFLRQFIQISIGKLNIENISVLDIESEINNLSDDASKILIILTLLKEYENINPIKYKYWLEKYNSYNLKYNSNTLSNESE